MKKTHSIHFGKQLFTIEEDAYDQLQQYLIRLERSFHGEDGIADIMEDIEMRFAELLLSYLGENRKVVVSGDISRGIASLGEPEMIANEEPQQEKQQYNTASTEKKLFRDTENGMLGGVSAGLGAYLNLDPTIVRAGFVIFLFFIGISIPTYIVLWVVLPDVKTPSDRLRMKGKAVTVDTLKEEANKAADRIKTDAQKARDRFKENSESLVNKGKSVFKVILQICGIGMITAAFIWLCIFATITTGLISVVPATGDGEYLSLAQFLHLSVPSGNTNILMWIAIITIGLSIGIGTTLVGIRFISKTKTRALRYGILANTIIFIFGTLIGIIAGVQTGRDFAVYTEIESQHFDIPSTGLNINEIVKTSGKDKIVATGGFDFFNIVNGSVQNNGVYFSYKPSDDSLFHISQVFSANGVDKSRSLARAKHISNECNVIGNELRVDPVFTFPAKDGLRSQHVEYIIEVPKDGKVYRNGKKLEFKTEKHSDFFRVNDGYEDWD